MIRPGQENIAGVLPGVLRALGAGGESALEFPSARRACVVMVDGLGYRNLDQRRGHTPTLRSLDMRAITTVVPSTTAAGICALGTGALPGRTAMGGYALRVPGSTDVFNLIAWNSPHVDPVEWQTVPTVFESTDLDTVKIHPRRFVDSGLTLAALRGGRTAVAEKLEARVDAAIAELKAGADLVYLYWGDLDSTGHHNGWESEAWIYELEHLDAELGRLRRLLPRDTLLVLTADHGMIDVNERYDIADVEELTRGVEVVAGESRALHLYTAKPQAVAARWRDVLGERAWIFTQGEAEKAGLFGPMESFAREVLGNVLVFAKGNLAIVDSRYQSEGAIGLVGVHGSLTEQEMMVPLVIDHA
ncbi:alkaline phosphatase family protein [Trueperella bernardiae]|uniref:Alkaline phosphatase family protein n=1 Tax=Trueperella bernardiae TaxID=59561 RepID=A0AAW6ZLE8_9ACTO|nr:alkaline phosphatase family protein [Trueperella bernardiae]MDK8602595.1 alkaline phosphatase family protein [Trueperella bernardiae]WIM08692.1 alkaline phosphatase family protein [Trueperella bernardiae]